MNINKAFKGVIATAMLLGATFSAQAGVKQFTVDDDLTAGESLVTADQIDGNYVQLITVNPDLTFDASIFASLSTLVLDNSNISGTGIGSTYGVYATLVSSGQVLPGVPAPGFFSLAGFSGELNLWLDVNNDTDVTFGATGSDAMTYGGTDSDDIKLGTGTDTGGTGLILPGGFAGLFDILFVEFALTVAGADYFVAPDPFYAKAQTDGDIDVFDLGAVPGTQEITGQLSVVFVPEPSFACASGHFRLLHLWMNLLFYLMFYVYREPSEQYPVAWR